MPKGRMSSGQRHGIHPEFGPKGGPSDPQYEWFVENITGTPADVTTPVCTERGSVALQDSVIVAYAGTEGEADRATPVVDYQAFDPVANGV